MKAQRYPQDRKESHGEGVKGFLNWKVGLHTEWGNSPRLYPLASLSGVRIHCWDRTNSRHMGKALVWNLQSRGPDASWWWRASAWKAEMMSVTSIHWSAAQPSSPVHSFLPLTSTAPSSVQYTFIYTLYFKVSNNPVGISQSSFHRWGKSDHPKTCSVLHTVTQSQRSNPDPRAPNQRAFPLSCSCLLLSF